MLACGDNICVGKYEYMYMSTLSTKNIYYAYYYWLSVRDQFVFVRKVS